MDPILQVKLRRAAWRDYALRRWSLLALAWLVPAIAGVVFLLVRAGGGGRPAWMFFLLTGVAAVGVSLAAWLTRQTKDLRKLAVEVENAHPELDGRLLTAIQDYDTSHPTAVYFHERLLRDVLSHAELLDWSTRIPLHRVRIAQVAHWLALFLFGFALWSLRPALTVRRPASEFPRAGIAVTPGDTNIERGASLVVLARFGGSLPAEVEMVVGDAGQGRIPLVKSLADPMFGGTIPEVTSNFIYHISYGGKRTRDYRVTVFEHPRLERADADLSFPDYTGMKPQHIQDTRRLSAVEGTRLDLSLKLNKAVASAILVGRGRSRNVIPLTVSTNEAQAKLPGYVLNASQNLELVLVDANGRSNKVSVAFVFNVLTNRTPELRLAMPRGDVRPTSLEEIPFEGTVWDDFGVHSFGIGYTVAGAETKWITLGTSVPGKEKRSFQYLLPLEDLHLEPDQLVSWFLWAEDTGPDGQLRRTEGDLFFGEIRPFEEVFREGQGGMDGQGQAGQQAQQQQGTPSSKVTELQKQIISATWRLQRDRRAAKPPAREGSDSSGRSSAVTPRNSASLVAAVPWPATALVFGQRADSPGQSPNPSRSRPARPPSTEQPQPVASDPDVVRESQAEAIKQANVALSRQDDPRSAALWRAAIHEMEKALERLKATAGTAEYSDALAAEQAAYQALLKLQEHEYNVSRSRRNQGQSGNSRQNQMQQQLDQMELTQSENRYETQRQAQRPQESQRKEELQVLNRLQELARRQQDVNERLKELQTALQEAHTDQEREEISRRLKRLQEEEQQMLSDLDELRQRMDRPENQSRMADQRRQLDQTRDNVQRAADAAAQGAASQALASGTRAQNQLEDVRDQLRKSSSSQFSEDMRDMRSQARELARQQQDMLDKLRQRDQDQPKSLSDTSGRGKVLDELARQNQRMTNLVQRATQVSEQAENAEPVLSRQLHDTVRKFAQDTSKDVKELQQQLLSRGMMTRSLMDRMRDPAASDGSKLLDTIGETLRMDFISPARDAAQRAEASFNNLKQGVERAAESIVGDDTEALRQAQEQLDQLSQQLQNEIAQGEGGGTNQRPGQASAVGQQANASRRNGQGSQPNGSQPQNAGLGQGTNSAAGDQQTMASSDNPSRNQNEGPALEQQDNQQQNAQADGQNPGQVAQNQGQGQRRANDSNEARPGANRDQATEQARNDSRDPAQGRSGSRLSTGRTGVRGGDSRVGGGGEGGDYGGNLRRTFDNLVDDRPDLQAGPITGEGYGPWSDRLRDVEDMVEVPQLRDELARIRDRARQIRQGFRQDRKKPDWAVVRMQVMNPLAEVRSHIAEELARRENKEALVPIDRDPVPTKYSELVRRYYEQLGK